MFVKIDSRLGDLLGSLGGFERTPCLHFSYSFINGSSIEVEFSDGDANDDSEDNDEESVVVAVASCASGCDEDDGEKDEVNDEENITKLVLINEQVVSW